MNPAYGLNRGKFQMQMKFFKLFLTIIWGLISLPISILAQVDTTLNIAEIQVSAPKIRTMSIGTQSVDWKAEDLEKINAQNVAELLNNETPVFIKSYGLGSLATSSIRGGSAGHTLVLWNGLPIQSPMLGLLDLSLLPLNATEEISFQKGGNSALWGSGAIGGMISLRNRPDFSNKISSHSGTQIGSFGTFEQQLKLSLGNKRFQSSTKVFYNQADNDFSYSISSGLPEITQTNAHLSQWNFLQDAYWKLNSQNQIAFHFWRQNSERQIPALTTQNQSLAHQDDIATRFSIKFQHSDDQFFINSKIGLSDEHNNYFDELSAIEARNRFKSIIGEINVQKTINNYQKLFIGTTHSLTKAFSDSYLSPPTENKSALFASYRITQENYQIQGSLRQELTDGNWVPITPILGINFQPITNLDWQFKVSRNYRLPTLNDRFWKGAGNPDLLPESGWSYESSITSKWSKNQWDIELGTTGFNRQIKNQILWIPNNFGLWSPHNISKVWSRGLESHFSIIYQKKDWKVQLKGGYDFIRSSNQISLTLPKIEKGEQLIYTPIHQMFSKCSLSWKNFQMTYRHSFTGKTTGINEAISNYQTGDFRIQFFQEINQIRGSFFLNINNIWDTDFFVIERRPMPGRYFQIGANIQLQSK